MWTVSVVMHATLLHACDSMRRRKNGNASHAQLLSKKHQNKNVSLVCVRAVPLALALCTVLMGPTTESLAHDGGPVRHASPGALAPGVRD